MGDDGSVLLLADGCEECRVRVAGSGIVGIVGNTAFEEFTRAIVGMVMERVTGRGAAIGNTGSTADGDSSLTLN